MNLDRMARLIRERHDAPGADAVDEILGAAEQEEALRVLVSQALAARRAWSMRLAAIAMNRFAASPSDEVVSDVPELIFQLARGVTEVDDDAAIQTCLNAVKWLNETERLRPRDEHDQQTLLELLSRSLDSDVYNTRESGLDTLTSIYDFGDLVELLGDEGTQELRRRVHQALSEADGELAEDLSSAERLLA